MVEDNRDAADMLGAWLVQHGHTVTAAASLQGARQQLAMQPPDLLLLDLNLPDGNRFELLAQSDLLSDADVVLMTGDASVASSAKALRLGAADYLVKPIMPQHLAALLSRLVSSAPPGPLAGCGQLLGASPAMQRVYQQIERVAGTGVGVFIHGACSQPAARAVVFGR